MDQFDPKLFHEIVQNLPISEILNICAKLPTQTYQKICKNESFWRKLLYRDYTTFSPLLKELERESFMSYLDLYREFYESPFFNSSDFQELYANIAKYTPIVYFADDDRNLTIIPTLTRVRYSYELSPFLSLIVTLPEDYPMKFLYEYTYSPISGNPIQIEIPAKIENGVIIFARDINDIESFYVEN